MGPDAHSLLIIYGTESGTAEEYAQQVAARVQTSKELSQRFSITLVDAKNLEGDELAEEDGFAIFIVSTYANGQPPPAAEPLFNWVMHETEDPRCGNTLRRLSFAVFGLGNTEYGPELYNLVSRRLDKGLLLLGGSRFHQRGEADAASPNAERVFALWLNELTRMLGKESGKRRKLLQKRVPMSRPLRAEKVQIQADSESESDDELGEGVVDVEDMGKAMAGEEVEGGCGSSAEGAGASGEGPPEMLSDRQRRTLTKQGYKLIGSHSAVKLCRWTKSMIRGRGGCYKHTFYGISSHQCMEATPNLSCANRCTFCWRHNSHPVGREWKWQMDDAEMIVDQAIAKHLEMIKSLRGIKDAVQERFEEGMHPRHCALSLVGEPINYPDINKFLSLLHSRGLSSFLVSNAQFPEQIHQLQPCTQLYISVDAPTQDALKTIDRPLFSDFWDRFLRCMDELRLKQQRTVYRLTLVKGYNTSDIPEYVNLIQRGAPDFIEVKGVTYSGGTRPIIGMKNVPWHTEVVEWVEQLQELLAPDYEIACEHEHSCCLVLARVDRFKIDGAWHTWIDFPKFIELANSGQPFTSVDYRAPTPHWAVYGAFEKGFNPIETRFRKIRNHPNKVITN